MERVLQEIRSVVCYLDDILITGKDAQEHLTNLEAVLKRLQDFGMRLKRNKCQWMQIKVEYLGYYIQAQGPGRSNVQELKSFLRLVHYYGSFLNNLSMTCRPLKCNC